MRRALKNSRLKAENFKDTKQTSLINTPRKILLDIRMNTLLLRSENSKLKSKKPG